MAEVTDAELEKKRETIEKLREQVAEANSTREERERSLSREIDMKQMEMEEARLRAALAEARDAAKATNVKAGASDLISVVEGGEPAQPKNEKE